MKLGTWWLTLLLCLGPMGAHAGDGPDCEAAYQKVDLLDVYDASVAPDRRKRALVAMGEASAHCAETAYSLGLLYRHGPDLPGNLVERDTGRARELILSYAEEGFLPAYADLAEMALREGQAREAMKWTQVYLYLLTRHSERFDRNGGGFDRSGYNADLLRRADAAWNRQKPAVNRRAISTDLTEYLASREASIAQKLTEHEADMRKLEAGKGDLRFKRIKGECSVDLGRSISGAYAMYLVEIQPDGHISRVALENFAPSPVAGERLKRCASMYEFEPFADTAPKVGRIPVVYGYHYGPRLKVKSRNAK